MPAKIRDKSGQLIRQKDILQITANLSRLISDCDTQDTEMVEQISNDVLEKAKEYAPRDTGALENAIKITKITGGRDSKGHFGTTIWSIGVDQGAIGQGGKPVRNYAYWVHEYMDYYDENGRFHRGQLRRDEGTQAKGEEAGGKYLRRAMNYWKDDIEELIGHV